MKQPKVVAVTEHVPRAGTILMWTLSGATDREAMRDAFAAHGVDEDLLPSPPTPATALRRAAGELRDRNRIVHAIGRGAGYALVDVIKQQGTDPSYELRAKATLDQVGRLVVEGGTPDMQKELRTAFNKHEEQLSTEDVSAWLTYVSKKTLDGVAMRGGGGVYFVPHAKLPELDTIVEALRACSTHSIYRIPAMAGDDAVQAILDAVEAEATAEATDIETALAEQKYGARGLETRINRTDEVEQKVARYEALLGVKVEALRARLDTLRQNLTVAMIKAQQAEAAERGERSPLAL